MERDKKPSNGFDIESQGAGHVMQAFAAVASIAIIMARDDRWRQFATSYVADLVHFVR